MKFAGSREPLLSQDDDNLTLSVTEMSGKNHQMSKKSESLRLISDKEETSS